MTRAAFIPRLMQESDAAVYVGMSASKLRTLGLRRRVLGGLRLYDRHDLDAFASSLRYEGDEVEGNPCDEIFGVR